MELITHVFSEIWTALDTVNVPIVNVSFKTFLVAILIMSFLVSLLNFFLGKGGDSKGDK